MKRKIITIDQDLCIGCGLCVNTCAEGAIGLVAGKARLLRDDYCDGLGNCLPVCPTGAITFEEREAAAFNEEATPVHQAKVKLEAAPSGCPGSRAAAFSQKNASRVPEGPMPSQLRQWPVQIKLAPVNAAFFDEANLLIAADCSAFSYGNFHNEFIRGHVTLIGCPKLDEGDYAEKLTQILSGNKIKSMKVVRMEVPCCGGIERAAIRALKDSGKFIPWQVVTITTDGALKEI